VQWLTPITLATKEVEIQVSGKPEQKVLRTPAHPITSWVWWCLPVIPAMQEHKNEDHGPDQLGQKHKTLFKT
jgi:hypothetical protein